jgi:sortase (surface protein transpeptidase)
VNLGGRLRAIPNRFGKWGVVALVLLLVGTGCVVLGVKGHQQSLARPAPPHATTPAGGGEGNPTTTTPTSQPAAPLAAVRSTPLSLRVPAIGLNVSLSTLGLNSDGTVQVPTDIQQPGWYRLGPTPGQVGSAVILGHVDSFQGPAVFYKLRNLAAGDMVDVSLADGVTAQFKVTSVAMYLKTGFPDQQVYASHGYSALQLVTCGGAFDSNSGHYLSNVVVYTSLVSLTPSTAVSTLSPT